VQDPTGFGFAADVRIQRIVVGRSHYEGLAVEQTGTVLLRVPLDLPGIRQVSEPYRNARRDYRDSRSRGREFERFAGSDTPPTHDQTCESCEVDGKREERPPLSARGIR